MVSRPPPLFSDTLLSEETLQAELGNQRGSWLWRKLWKQPGYQEEKKLYHQLVAVIEYTQQHADARQPILEAFDNDTAFHTALDEPQFRFHYLTLEKATQNVIKPLMIAFYEDLLSSGRGSMPPKEARRSPRFINNLKNSIGMPLSLHSGVQMPSWKFVPLATIHVLM